MVFQLDTGASVSFSRDAINIFLFFFNLFPHSLHWEGLLELCLLAIFKVMFTEVLMKVSQAVQTQYKQGVLGLLVELTTSLQA